MYHFIVSRKLRKAFRDINAGRYEGIVPQFSRRHRHVMYGRHGLAGERHNAASTAQWYERLQRVLPGLRFDIRAVAVTGWPWDTTAVVTWTDHLHLPDGNEGSNQGVHEFTLRWGKVHALVVHCDTARLERYCKRIAALGVVEAAAAPIDDLVLPGKAAAAGTSGVQP